MCTHSHAQPASPPSSPSSPPSASSAAPPAPRSAYFIDGYHGGIYGHIPPWQTKFMADKLKEFPYWKINLELEPESWDTIAVKYPADYQAFKSCIADQTGEGRVEYINPAYGQSYLYNISGESIIRQLYYGMRKLRQHFPGLVFSTYSSEEPCFTSALPQILRSYGFTYASLKNPNTCWGGYTRAFGGELVNWVGPDGTPILTAPRYAIEALKPKSTWETIASNNSVAYVLRAFQAGIENPVGMCLQDAGWANGPWIGTGEAYRPGSGNELQDVSHPYHPTVFETWRGYFQHHTPGKTSRDWRFSQEDVLTSLVWGGQILQQVARKVRTAENRIAVTEKLASMAAVFHSVRWPGESLDEAWRTLLLSQHHDCWIVPYNSRQGLTWADDVDQWIGNTLSRCDTILEQSESVLTTAGNSVTVFNPTATDRDECVELALPEGWTSAAITDEAGNPVATQPATRGKLLFRARVPSLGSVAYHLHQPQALAQAQPQPQTQAQPKVHVQPAQGARVIHEDNDDYRIETDSYTVVVSPGKGGAITRLSTKGPTAKNFIDGNAQRYFNELRGNFDQEGGFRSSTETPAQVRIIENGPLRVRLQIDGRIAGTPFTQLLSVTRGEPRIDVHLEIGWTGDHKIGESPDSIKGYPLKKEFYNDSFKLQALFPVALRGRQVYKNAPFDVLKSRLPTTFFDSWDSIKNVVVLNWVDVTDAEDKYGLAVFTDQTTSYAHGPNYPLALTVQYSGPGLFGRDYSITGPTTMDYAILPHTGRWDRAGIWAAADRWNEPLLVHPGEGITIGSLLRLSKPGWEVSAITVSGHDLLVRLFNAAGKDSAERVFVGFPIKTANLVALDGHVIKPLPVTTDFAGKKSIIITAPRFGIRTIQLKDAVK